MRWKIFNVAIENVFSSIFVQGGDERGKILAGGFTEIHHENCIVTKGVWFLNND